MTEGNDMPAAIELLLVLTVQTALVRAVTGTPLGDRTVFDIEGGTFTGPRLAGRIPAAGGDWLTRTTTGSRLDVRLILETHDGATILYPGRGALSLLPLQIETSCKCDTSAVPA
jgi:hypothetical protein